MLQKYKLLLEELQMDNIYIQLGERTIEGINKASIESSD